MSPQERRANLAREARSDRHNCWWIDTLRRKPMIRAPWDHGPRMLHRLPTDDIPEATLLGFIDGGESYSMGPA